MRKLHDTCRCSVLVILLQLPLYDPSGCQHAVTTVCPCHVSFSLKRKFKVKVKVSFNDQFLHMYLDVPRKSKFSFLTVPHVDETGQTLTYSTVQSRVIRKLAAVQNGKIQIYLFICFYFKGWGGVRGGLSPIVVGEFCS